MVRNKIFSVLNLAGLAVGLCCFLLIALYVIRECSYDRYNRRAQDIYRVNMDVHWGGQDIYESQSSDMMGALLKKDYPQVEEYTRVYNQFSKKLVKRGSEYLTEEKVAYVDSTFFNVFTLPAIEGNAQTALNEPNSVVIDAATAMKYFGTTQGIVGKTLVVRDGDKPVGYKITAVIKNIPVNSHFHFDLLFPMRNLDYQWGQIGNVNFYTYLLLKPGTDPKAFDKNFDEYFVRYELPSLKEQNINSLEEFKKSGNKFRSWLMPLTDIHLSGSSIDEIEPPGSIQYVYIFSAVALFILLIACINFMNLSTARSAGRAKEVGIRKVLGTGKKELIWQFLAESSLMAGLSLILALVLTWLTLPSFNSLTGMALHLHDLGSPYILALLLALPLVVGFLAGCYPAFFLSSFRPIEVLKGQLSAGSKSSGLRSVLVVFQFGTSIFLIVATLVVYRQLQYIRNRNLGFNKDQVLIINSTDALGDHVDAFKREMLRFPGVKSGTIGSFLPVSQADRNAWNFSRDPVSTATNNFNAQVWNVDEDYLQTMGMTLRSGRNFSPSFGGDSSALVINETTAKILGYKDPVGRNLYVNFNGQAVRFPIIGVVKDFNYESMHQAIGPLVLRLAKSPALVSFKVTPEVVGQVIAKASETWKALSPGMPFSYHFLDRSFAEMYRNDQRVGEIALVFSFLAIGIACLGIFGLATFMAEQRTKEIGIRKVLGASVGGIVQLLNRDFIRLVALAFLIAAPTAWWAMHHWLQNYVFKTTIDWWVFLAAGGSTLFIALLTVSFQSIRAAITNPVKSLRTE